jgi:hypothetical protein
LESSGFLCLFIGQGFSPAESPLSPPFHPHSSMSDGRWVQVGCSRFSRCGHLFIDLPFHPQDGSWARRLTQSPELGARAFHFRVLNRARRPPPARPDCCCAAVRRVGIELGRAGLQVRVTSLALSVARWVHNSTVATFPEAPLQCRTARFPGSGLKPWPLFHRPSQLGGVLSAGSHTPRLPRFAHSLVPLPRRLCASSVSDRRAA